VGHPIIGKSSSNPTNSIAPKGTKREKIKKGEGRERKEKKT